MMVLSDETLESFVSGKCVYLAAALNRERGWEIQVVIEPADDRYPPFVGHAWCVDSATGYHVDIDGAYPPAANGWIRGDNKHVTGLTEDALHLLTLGGASRPFTVKEWNEDVEATYPVLRGYLLPKIAAA